MMFIDTHCHFDFPPFEGDAADSLARAAEAGVEKIIIPAIDASRFERVCALAADHSPLYAALGLHPIVIENHVEAHLGQLETLLQQRPRKLVAIGEIGLDLYRDNPQFDKQQRFLEAQLKLAKRYALPVILHSRRTHDKLAQILRRHDLPRCGVVHGFAGSLQQAQAFIKLGYAIGVGGTITYERASKTRQTVAQLPLSSLLLETDAPDMPLQGFQGQPNRPERARQVWEVLCSLREESPEEIADALWHNSQQLFQLDPAFPALHN
ncbi:MULTISPECIES: TatD family hydrolase [unclassified Pantoea]|uniref:TatD family hydrolase n=1 Tax=unclassified Pantoea TaxID=2630326 RepID=UPI001232829D|nr:MULTISPECIES: TatD family hydrolase [unclassified Pantoea]KAA5957349.1 metal-dependent hydrolase [Pantoea sp. VH_24]KAA5960813.1 metal-dependent hydrolase [Pantoea sp. VH_16]KAA5965227.1 metal-dependent hydrolase [Pantoea sp. VH_18]KAA5999131.1 metal-dependent hydrolase [Pantoea sp. M_1]KAA6004922.1 metal-dependent hydrolase [Pantoea sp. F_7]